MLLPLSGTTLGARPPEVPRVTFAWTEPPPLAQATPVSKQHQARGGRICGEREHGGFYINSPFFRWPNFQAKVRFSCFFFLGEGFASSTSHYHSSWRNVAPCVEDMDFCGQCATFGPLLIRAVLKELKSSRREVVRSSAGASVVYPPFLGVVRVAYPDVWFLTSNPL